MSEEYLISVDIGSTRTKAALFDRYGNLLSRHSCQSGVISGRDGVRAESDPDDWVAATVTAVSAVASKAEGRSIAGICIASEGPTLVVVDDNITPCCPALLWMDNRATGEARELSSLTGLPTNASAIPAKALWLSRHAPAVLKKGASILQPLDYVASKFTGVMRFSIVSDVFNAAPSALWEVTGLPESLLPPRVIMGELHGRLKAEWAHAMGIPEGLPVIAGTGGVDAIQVILGTNTLEEGIVCDKAGTSEGIEIVTKRHLEDGRFFIAPHPLVAGHFHVGGMMSTTGKALEWFRKGVYRCRSSFRVMMREAGTSPPGAKGLVFLPYLMGERTPFWDEQARGVFFGLSLSHTRADMTRALLEGVAFGIGEILDILKGHGISMTEIRAAGGPARSRLWNQIKADVTGLPVRVCAIPDVELLGLAIVAGKSLGIYPDLKKAASEMVRFKPPLHPRPEASQWYEHNRRIYHQLYDALKPLYHMQ